MGRESPCTTPAWQPSQARQLQVLLALKQAGGGPDGRQITSNHIQRDSVPFFSGQSYLHSVCTVSLRAPTARLMESGHAIQEPFAHGVARRFQPHEQPLVTSWRQAARCLGHRRGQLVQVKGLGHDRWRVGCTDAALPSAYRPSRRQRRRCSHGDRGGCCCTRPPRPLGRRRDSREPLPRWSRS